MFRKALRENFLKPICSKKAHWLDDHWEFVRKKLFERTFVKTFVQKSSFAKLSWSHLLQKSSFWDHFDRNIKEKSIILPKLGQNYFPCSFMGNKSWMSKGNRNYVVYSMSNLFHSVKKEDICHLSSIIAHTLKKWSSSSYFFIIFYWISKPTRLRYTGN